MLTCTDARTEFTCDSVERVLAALGMYRTSYSLKFLHELDIESAKILKEQRNILILCNTLYSAKRLFARLKIENVVVSWYNPEASLMVKELVKDSKDKEECTFDGRKLAPRRSAAVARRMIMHSLGLSTKAVPSGKEDSERK